MLNYIVPKSSIIADGLPRSGVINVGEVANTLLPVPVLAVAPGHCIKVFLVIKTPS